ncbi:hypothetical protein EE612_016970 [Oryza sativa]|nr:hypothetical protein EE612_016970 [Oryza sativa]
MLAAERRHDHTRGSSLQFMRFVLICLHVKPFLQRAAVEAAAGLCAAAVEAGGARQRRRRGGGSGGLNA